MNRPIVNSSATFFAKLAAAAVVASFLLTPVLVAAQQDDPAKNTQEQQVDPAIKWAGVADIEMLVFEHLHSAYSKMLPAKDGHYLAHDKVELQTYYDLGLSYKYIEADYLRKQLDLPDEQGIIITAAAVDGEGHKNGFQSGDIVLKVDEEPVDTQYDFVIALSKDRGTERLLQVRRNGTDEPLKVRLSETRLVAEKHWIIGVYVDEISGLAKSQLAIDGGVAVTGLVEDGPAHNAGVVEHDIVSHINGQLVNSLADLKKVVGEGDGAELTLSVVRRGKKISVSVRPIESPRNVDSRTGKSLRFIDLASDNSVLLDTLVEGTDEQLTVRFVPTTSERLVRSIFVEDAQKQGTAGQSEVTDRLDRLEATMKRMEAVLKAQSGKTDDQ